jgi:AcrR family transcriptional regulator
MASTRATRREEIRDQLLTLIEGMLDDGLPFAEVSVEQLTSATGMSRTRFYHYFEDRNDLLRAWFERINAELAAASRAWYETPVPLTRRRLGVLLERSARAYRPHATLMFAVESAAATDPSLRALLDDAARAEVDALSAHIAAAQAAGAVDLELDAWAIAEWLTVLLWRGRLHLFRGAAHNELSSFVAAQTALVWNVLYDPQRRVIAQRAAAGH